MHDEDRELAALEVRRLRIHRDRVSAQEQVRVVVVEFRPLPFVRGVFDGQRVQPELLLDVIEACLIVDRANVEPDNRAGVVDALGDVSDRKVLFLEHPVAVQPRARHLSRAQQKSGRRSARLREPLAWP